MIDSNQSRACVILNDFPKIGVQLRIVVKLFGQLHFNAAYRWSWWNKHRPIVESVPLNVVVVFLCSANISRTEQIQLDVNGL